MTRDQLLELWTFAWETWHTSPMRREGAVRAMDILEEQLGHMPRPPASRAVPSKPIYVPDWVKPSTTARRKR